MKRGKEHRPSGGRLAALRALPWAALLQAAVAASDRWRSLSAKDRARFTELLRASRGRLGNLSSRERDELRKLVGKLDLKGMGREVIPLVGGRGRGRKRR